MDKNRIMDDKKKIYVHQTGKGVMQPIHEAYGLGIIGGGAENRTQPDSFETCPKRYFEHYSISHLIEGEGKLLLCESGEMIDVEPGDAIIITPGTINRYGGINGKSYVEDTVTFIGPVADMLKNAGVIRDGVFHLGKVRRLLQIQEYQRDPAHDSQIKANIELQNLLVDLYLKERSRERSSGNPRFEALLDEIKSDISHWWTVEEMTSFCHLSDDQLRRLFLKHTGCLPKLYVDRYKMHHAAELLITTEKTLSAIAASLGFLDQYHFSRRFKSVMGVSPREYRAKRFFFGTEGV